MIRCMGMIQFVRNFDDLSTDKGYQFKFHCDKCANGFMSRFQTSTLGMASSLFRAAGDIFGGWASGAGNSAYEIQRAVGGKAHDSALAEAVEEGKAHFHQCTRCGHWVCPDICWNEKAGQCLECAPDFQRELSSAQAQAKADAVRQQAQEAASKVDYMKGIDMSADSYVHAPQAPGVASPAARCGSCGVSVGTAKFCPDCGTAVKTGPKFCPGCGAKSDGAKFCPDCGQKMG